MVLDIDISAATIFSDMTKSLLNEKTPSKYINSLSEHSSFQKYPFNMLYKQKSTEQSLKYHPEGNVWNHTLLVLDEAAKVRDQSKDPKAFMWAALLHDIGKPDTTRTKKGKITSYDHDSVGEKLCIEFLHFFSQEEYFIQSVAALVRYHMHMLYILRGLPFADMKGMLQRVDVEDIALLCLCDRLGRKDADTHAEEEEYKVFLKRLKQFASSPR